MRKLNQSGSLLLPLIIMIVLFLGAAGFGTWAFAGRQDYKNNSDKKSVVAAERATAAESSKKDAEFVEAEKSPLKTYTGPVTYGDLRFNFPKTWNQYVVNPSTTSPINLYFNPEFIPDLSSTAKFALRVQVLNATYLATLATYSTQVKAGTATISAYNAAKVPNVLGSIVNGAINTKTSTGTMVLLPLRDKTIVFWTEDPNFKNDFVNTVLPSISYAP